MGSPQGDRNSRRTGRSGKAAAAAEGLQGGAAFGHQTSTCHSTTAFFMFRAGGRASSFSTTSPIPQTRRRRARSTSVASCAGQLTRRSPAQALNGGPQMVEISRDGKRVYFTNSLYSPWDEQFYPDGVKSWMVKIDANPKGGMKLDEKFFVEFDGVRAHQLRLEGGDASSDSYCYSDAK